MSRRSTRRRSGYGDTARVGGSGRLPRRMSDSVAFLVLVASTGVTPSEQMMYATARQPSGRIRRRVVARALELRRRYEDWVHGVGREPEAELARRPPGRARRALVRAAVPAAGPVGRGGQCSSGSRRWTSTLDRCSRRSSVPTLDLLRRGRLVVAGRAERRGLARSARRRRRDRRHPGCRARSDAVQTALCARVRADAARLARPPVSGLNVPVTLAEWVRSTSSRRTKRVVRARLRRADARAGAGWPAIAAGGHVLIQAPTGSGKTLAAFLIGIDRLNDAPGEGLRLLYVSPLKALNYDIERNLRGPLAGSVGALGRRADGRHARRGAAADAEDAARHPHHDARVALPAPHLAGARDAARDRDGDPRRGARGRRDEARRAPGALARAAGARSSSGRSSGSGSRRPSGRWPRSARFVAGTDREIELVDAGSRKELDLEVVVPLEDMRELGSTAELSVPPLADGVQMGSGVEQSSRSIWPSIYPAILELVRQHRSTIVFVNNRRLAERLALRMNELAEEEIARAHHGSLAREQRFVVEELLKAGRDPVPRRDVLARARHRHGRRRPRDPGREPEVGRARAPAGRPRGPRPPLGLARAASSRSSGPTCSSRRSSRRRCARARSRRRASRGTRSTSSRSRSSRSAPTRRSRSTSCTSSSRRAYPFSELSRAQLENVLDMLAGRYPSDEFAELRPRIVWDRTAGTVRGATGARRLAVTNAGTIPDRGLFGVFLVDGGGRVGELDEEMVYEAREGQTFLLGASTWRIEDITRDRVLVSPAPGVPGVAPFWKGEGVGPAGRARREDRTRRRASSSRSSRRSARSARRGRVRPRRRAARNLVTFLREQEGATGVVPSDRSVVVERFRDEIGDWRVCILSPFGGRVHAPWAMALARPAARRARARRAVDLVGRRHRTALPGRRRAAAGGRPAARARRDRGARPRRARAVGALRLAVPRERVARAADPAPASGPADAALAAAAEGAEPAAGRAPLPAVPDRARDVPRGACRTCSTCPRCEDPARDPDAGARPRRGGDRVGLAVRLVAPLRLRRDLHVRGRHTARGAARAGALARPRAAARADGRRGAARAARRGRDRACGGVAAAVAAQRGRAARLFVAPGRSSTASTTRGSRRHCCASGARFGCGSAARAAAGGRGRGARPRRVRAWFRRAACRRCSSSRSRSAAARAPAAMRGRAGRSRPRRSRRDSLSTPGRRSGARALERDETARSRRAPAGRHGARVVRSRRSAPDPARDARDAATRGRAGRAGGVRRASFPPGTGSGGGRDAPRGARAAAGRSRFR